MKDLILPSLQAVAIAALPLNSILQSVSALPSPSARGSASILQVPASACGHVALWLRRLQPSLDGRFNSSRLFLQMKWNPFYRASTKIKTSRKPCRTQLMNRSKQRVVVQGCLRNDVLPFQTSEGCKNLTSS